MFRACELKDQTYKKTRTLQFSEKSIAAGPLRSAPFGEYNPLICEHPLRAAFGLKSEGEKPPKIRKKSSQEQSSWELLALLPLKRQRKQAKSREHWSEKFLGTSVPRNLFFFLGGFSAPY